MAQRLLEVDYDGGEFTLRFTPSKLRLLPEATRDHLRMANKELLLAMRSMLDKAIESMEPKERGSGRRRTKIEVKEEKEEKG